MHVVQMRRHEPTSRDPRFTMSVNTSPSMTSLSLNSPSMAGSSNTSTTSQSTTSADDETVKPGSNISLSVDNHPSGLPWILHRIVECQLLCELPLRIMFAYNAGQKLPTLKQAHDWWHYGTQGKLIIKFLSSQQKITPSLEDTSIEDLKNPPCGPTESINPDHNPRDRFMDQGNDLLFDINFSDQPHARRQSEGLPPGFVQKFCLDTIFAEEYKEADFSLALQGLDYIRDFEVTRRASLREAAERLGITRENWHEVLHEDRDANKWVLNMQALELDIAAYYAAIFIDLRVWTMISELQCPTFYKPNVLAMLNTLFPPCVKELPNDKIDKSVLHKQRAHIYQYILAVEEHGPSILKHFAENLLKEGTGHSWPETRKNLVLYFDRADNMISASTAVHGIQFFRNRASKYSGRTPSMSERLQTSESASTTFTSQRSRTSTSSSVPRSPARTFDSSKSRQRVHSRQNKSGISTPVDSNTYFEPFETPWTSQYTFRNSSNSGNFRGATPSIRNAAAPFTPLADAFPMRSRNLPSSRQTTPLIEQRSDAAQHDSFARPITPFEDKRRDVIARRETISGGSSPPPELSRTFSNTLEISNYFNPGPAIGNRKATVRSVSSVRPPLLRDNLEFLKHPYEPEAPRHPLPSTPSEHSLKKSSIGSFFLRRKSSIASIATLKDNPCNENENALGIEMNPLKPMRSMESFPRFSQDPPSERPTLRKQVSFNNSLEKSENKTTMQSFRSRAASSFAGSGLTEIAEDEQLKRILKSKASLPNLRSKRFYEKGEDGSGVDHFFVQTGDDYERYRHMAIPRPATSQGPKKKEVRKAKSFASIKSWATNGTADSKKTIRPRKSSVFRREPQEGENIRSKTISEPFAMVLQSTPALLPAESRSKEYTRKWFIEEARAKRYGLNRPGGEPMKDEEEKEEKKGFEWSSLRRKVDKEGEGERPLEREKEFEMPRATPIPPTRPNRQRWDSIFPRRALPKKEKPKTHTPLDLSKYAKYLGKEFV